MTNEYKLIVEEESGKISGKLYLSKMPSYDVRETFGENGLEIFGDPSGGEKQSISVFASLYGEISKLLSENFLINSNVGKAKIRKLEVILFEDLKLNCTNQHGETVLLLPSRK